MKLALWGAGVVGVAAAAALQRVGIETAPARPEGVWPVTVAGWFGLLGPVVAMVAGWYAVTVGREFRALRKEHTDALNAFGQRVEGSLNGLGERVKRTEGAQAAQDEFNARVIAHMADSTRDRQNLTHRLDSIDRTVQDIHSLLLRRPTA